MNTSKIFLSVCMLACLMLSAPLTALETGKPSDISADTDYFRKGMDADKAGDTLTAVKMMRYAFYKTPTADTFFWYCEKLSKGKFYDELIAEYTTAADSNRYSPNYGAMSARMTAEALRKQDKIDKATAILVDAYMKNTKDQELIGSMLVHENMLDTGYSRSFMRHSLYPQVLKIMNESLLKNTSDKDNISAAKELYFFLMVAACEQAVAGNSKQAKKLIDDAGAIVSRYGAMDAICNQANYNTMKKAVYAYKKDGQQKTYNFRWLCLYTDGIDCIDETGKKIKTANTKEFVRAKTEDLAFNLAAATVFYYYISGEKINMQFDIHQYNAVSTKILKSNRFSKADIRSIEPFPTQLMIEKDGTIDGVMFFYPAFKDTAYLGGENNSPIVPYILNSRGKIFMLNLLSGAAANVYIHEIFHGFESAYKISEAHVFAQENKNKWPDWYKQITSKNGTTAEWSYYERIFSDTIARDSSIQFPAQKSLKYPKDISDKALNLYSRFGSVLCAQVDTELYKAEELAKKDSASAEKLYLKILSTAPDHPDALFKTGFFYHWKIKNRAEAQRYYDRYLELYTGFPSTFTAALYSCTWYLNAGNTTKVIEITDRSLPYMTTPYDIYHLKLNRAYALLRLNRKDEAKLILADGSKDGQNPIRELYSKELDKLKK